MNKILHPINLILPVFLFLEIFISGCAVSKTSRTSKTPDTPHVEQDSNLVSEEDLFSSTDNIDQELVTSADVNKFDSRKKSLCLPQPFSVNNQTAMTLQNCIDELIKKNDFPTALREMENFLITQISPGSQMVLLAKYAHILELTGDSEKAADLWSKIHNQKARLDSVILQSQTRLSATDKSPGNETKTLVEELRRTYFEGGHYKELSQKALILLKKIKSSDSRKEIKQIVGDAWKRDEEQVFSHLKEIKSGYLNNRNKQQSINIIDSLKVIYPTQKMAEFNSLRAWVLEQDGGIAGQSGTDSILASADELISRGHYIAALPILEKISDPSLKQEADTRREDAGQQFCKEKRKNASEYFKNSRKQKSDSLKVTWLRRASSELDSCLNFFPDISISEKVRKNRNLIQEQLENTGTGK